MSILKIPQNLSTETLEELFKSLGGTSKNVDLQIPIEIDYRGFGVLPTLFLFFFTWIRKKEGRLIIPIKKETIETDTKDLEKLFLRDYYGYLLISTIWKQREIVNLEGNSLKLYFNNYTKRMHEQIDFLFGLPNESIVIPCFDHYSKEKGLSHWFYSTSFIFAEAPSSLDTSVVRFFEALAKNFKTKIYGATKEALEDIQKILWELLKNTHEHATKDYLNQATLNPSTRGLYMRIQRGSKKSFIENAKGNKGLTEYYNKSLQEGLNFLLEITVFDSGPGLAKRFLGNKWTQNISMDDEVNTIKRCLIKGQTSVVDLNGINKGYGLHDVLNVLSRLKGFLKIRSGRASIYRDLIKSPHTNAETTENIDLFDWSNSTKDYIEMSNTEGTSISLVYSIN